jgi:hypothetical protein
MNAVVRLGLVLLTAVELVLGLWTLLSPASFYAVVPTADVTPFSEHPFRDFGGATLGLAVVLGAAAVWTQTRMVVVALTAYLVFSVPHLVFHLEHLREGGGAADTAIVVGLVGSVLLPVALLAVALRLRMRTASAGAPEQATGRTSPGHGPFGR